MFFHLNDGAAMGPESKTPASSVSRLQETQYAFRVAPDNPELDLQAFEAKALQPGMASNGCVLLGVHPCLVASTGKTTMKKTEAILVVPSPKWVCLF